jgi:hypothetical protein
VGREKQVSDSLTRAPREKSGSDLEDTSIHSLCSAKVWVLW